MQVCSRPYPQPVKANGKTPTNFGYFWTQGGLLKVYPCIVKFGTLLSDRIQLVQ